MGIIKFLAYAVNGQSLDSNSGCDQNFNCEELSGVKNAYAIRKVCGGCGGRVEVKISLTPSSPADSNDAAGVLVTKQDGSTLFIYNYTADDFTTECNKCCGETGFLSGTSLPAFVPPSASANMCLTTTGDDGTLGFVNDVALKIFGKYDVTKGISRFATNKFNFFTTDPIGTISLPTGWSVAAGACA